MTSLDAKALLVDLDGTLYDPWPVKIAMGLELLLAGRDSYAVVQAFRAAHEATRRDDYGSPDPYRAQLNRAAEALGVAPAHVEQIVHRWMIEQPGKWLRRFRRRKVVRRIEDHVARGGVAALVSDYPARQKLHSMGVASLFSAVVACGEPDGPTRLKPSPDGYLAAAEALGALPSDCLVLGDRLDTDGEAARRASMRFELVR